MLIDTHCHVQMRQFANDREAVIASAFSSGVERLIVPGIDVGTSKSALDLAQRHPGRIFAGVGTHPHDASTLTPEALIEQHNIARQPGIVAIGEIGLDFYRDLSPRNIQRDALVAQLGLARELDLPVILHNRESHEDMIALLRAHGTGVRGVFHCFIGDRAMATDALDLGFYLSFAGPLTYPRNDELRDVAAWAPADRILVETDSPYLSPHPLRGKRNEPQRVTLVARTLAQVRGVTEQEIAEITTRNAAAAFRLPEPTPKTGV
ncbi:MAG TPA: TatD family hydrolase [Ktedonobacterales bacterium]|nr:TatD family hydrolase [Ktedonobacterales bacterium]